MSKLFSLLALLFLFTGADVDARIHRSQTVKADFQRENPCPANGSRRGQCIGYEKDHVIPLKCGGADSVENMQWLTVEAHKEKTKSEAKLCRNKNR